ncbi:MAG: trigger factor [Bacteroidetes bacterium]|nr:trigger factor [Bacteroidota bacterium]
MATVTRENIGLLNDKLTVTILKEDYYASFEKTLKSYSKQASIPGFRKGMVPAGMIKKMYGPGIFSEQIIKTIESELNDYLRKETLPILGQPIPMANADFKPDMQQPADQYQFDFEIGLQPDFSLNLNSVRAPYHRISVTDAMVNEEIDRLRKRLGKMTEPETVTDDENVLNLLFEETDAAGNVIEDAEGKKKDNSLLVKYFSESVRPQWMGKKKEESITVKLYEAFEEKEREWVIKDLGLENTPESAAKTFKITLTKIGLVEFRVMDEAFFKEAIPGKEITTESDFRAAIQQQIQEYWDRQSSNQLQHHLYHVMLEETKMELPEGFLKKWLRVSGEKAKTEEAVEQEFPTFKTQLRWTLISDRIIKDNKIEATDEEVKDSLRQQVMGYFGNMGLSGTDMSWMEGYVDGLMKDEQQYDSAYRKVITEKLFEWAEQQVQKEEKSVTVEEFIKMNEAHQHEHH